MQKPKFNWRSVIIETYTSSASRVGIYLLIFAEFLQALVTLAQPDLPIFVYLDATITANNRIMFFLVFNAVCFFYECKREIIKFKLK